MSNKNKNLDPMKDVQVTMNQRCLDTVPKMKAIHTPYDFEKAALEATNPCDYQGPRL